MANWLLPSLASTYTNFVTEVINRDVDCARGFSTAYTLATNLTTGTIRWHETNKNWEKYNGSTWDLLATVFAINTTGYATHLAGGNSTTLLGSLGYQTDANVTTLLSPNTTTTKKFLTLTGTGTNGAAPGWNIINDGDLPAALTGKTYNGNTFTAGTGILTLAASKTFTCSNTLTFTGTDGSYLNIGTGGILGTAAYTSSGTYALLGGNAAQAFAASTFTGNLTGNVTGNADTATKSGIPMVDKSVAYTTVLADRNTGFVHPVADNNARTFTIDASLAYTKGDTITFINEVNTVTVAISGGTLTLAGIGTTGSRTLNSSGMATAVCRGGTLWSISGAGLL